MDKVVFKGYVAREAIGDEYYPRTRLFLKKPRRKLIWYWGTPHKGCEWEDRDGCGSLASYALKRLLPKLTYDDDPIEVEITVRIVKNDKKK